MPVDKQALAEVVRNIDKKYGEGTLFTIDSKSTIVHHSTGIPDLDAIIGGGIPEARITEIAGPESVGKTSLAFHIAARYKQVVFVDFEGFSNELAALFGNRRGQFVIRRPTWGEQAMETMIDFADAGMPLIILDSVPAMIPKKEYELKDGEKQAGVAMVAGLLSRRLPRLLSACEKNGSSVIFINQVRDKMGGMPWGDPFTTPGGRQLKHLSSLRLRMGRKSWIVGPEKVKYGLICKVQTVKSKVCAPMGEAELPLVWGKGFVEHENIIKEVRAIRKAERNEN